MKFVKKKKPPKTDVLKEKKELKPKTARRLFLSLLVLLMISAPTGFLLGKQANVTASKATKKLDKLEESLLATNKESLDPVLADRFLSEFIQTYMNKPDDEKAFSKRQTQLDTFMVTKLPVEEFKGVSQELKEVKLYDFTQEGKTQIAQYSVRYEVTYPVEKERTVKKKEDKKDVTVKEKYKDSDTKEVAVLLNIPFIQKENKFKVTALPYYSKMSDLTLGSMERPTIPSLELKKASDSETEKVTDFLDEFYQVYTEGDVKQVAYMMADPVVLDGTYQVKKSDPTVYQDGEKLVVYDSILLSEKGSDNGHMEQLVFHLSKKAGNFYIDTLIHDFGGKTDEN